MRNNFQALYGKELQRFFEEDELAKNLNYLNSLPEDTVVCKLKFKDDLLIAGLPIFFETFNYLLQDQINYDEFLEFEGRKIQKASEFEISFNLPFNVALCGERIALNLLQRCCSVATYTSRFVELAGDVKILDTRKTTPGLRFVEKYAVVKAGGFNHRFSQTDSFMIKDNHKSFFGGLAQAVDFFRKLNTVYTSLVTEIHDLAELTEARALGLKFFLLDNFSIDELKKAISTKVAGEHFEVSGGITLNSLKDYAIDGVDAISSGSIIYNAPQVDISLKYKRI